MNQTYEWLYDCYAEPRLRKLPEFRDGLLEQLAESVPEQERLDWIDRLEALRLDWCTAAFTAGVQLGMGLLAPYARRTPPFFCPGEG